MRRIAAILFALAAPAAFAYTADELAAKNVAAKGGSASLAAIHTLRLTGKARLRGGALELAVLTAVKRPQSIRYEALLQDLTEVQAYDGTQAWQIDPFQGRKDPEKLSADDAKGMSEDAADFLGALVDYQGKGYKLDYLGTEDIDGTEAHKLRVSRANGDISYVYLDPDAFLEIRTVNRRIEHGVPSETVIDYSDYEKVGGVYVALAREYWPKGAGVASHRKLQYEKAEANVDLADSLFAFPAAPAAAAGR